MLQQFKIYGKLLINRYHMSEMPAGVMWKEIPIVCKTIDLTQSTTSLQLEEYYSEESLLNVFMAVF